MMGCGCIGVPGVVGMVHDGSLVDWVANTLVEDVVDKLVLIPGLNRRCWRGFWLAVGRGGIDAGYGACWNGGVVVGWMVVLSGLTGAWMFSVPSGGYGPSTIGHISLNWFVFSMKVHGCRWWSLESCSLE